MIAYLLAATLALTGLGQQVDTLSVQSPSQNVMVQTWVADGTPFYAVSAFGQDVILPSRLGFSIVGAPNFGDTFDVASHEMAAHDETWEQVWGEKRIIRDHHHELRLDLREKAVPHRELVVVFRVFDDGVGFRYEFPDQETLHDFEIADEHTEFALAGDHTAWWIGAYQSNRYEYLYHRSAVSATKKVHTPFTLETRGGLYLSFHEAALTDFPSMTLANVGGNRLKADLVPWADGTLAKVSAPHVTPWRTIQIAQKPGDLMTSYLILNLNEPNKLDDTSWITPGKYVGVWWMYHIGLKTWYSGPDHGATTEQAIKYLDFAAENGFIGALVEGWNIGWNAGEGDDPLGDLQTKSEAMRFTEPYPDFDLEEVAAHARSRGVSLIGHHETFAGVTNYERQMEDAFDLYEELGVKAVKTGYVGDVVDDGEPHHGQRMVRHFRDVVELAAKHHVMVNVHEPIKDTGIRRTWPNMMTREGARGMEYNAWDYEGGNPPEHETILAFTRMLSGPFDMTPGIFDHELESRPGYRVPTTLARQLAFYVVIYSPLHMAADLVENYEGQPAFQFIQDVPTDWEDTQVPAAKIGDYVAVARKDRNSEDWYLGALTDENDRKLDISLSFLDKGRTYQAEIYADGSGTSFRSNQTGISINEMSVTSETVLQVAMGAGGGYAVRFSLEEGQ